jgi:chromosome segregation ATPase
MAKKKVAENQPVVEYNENITHLPEAIPQEGVEEITIAKKLLSLYNLQQICSQIDKIRVVRGELPDEVRDLEDALEGMQTRIEKHKEEFEELNQKIFHDYRKNSGLSEDYLKASNELMKYDNPSTLYDQLQWLNEANFRYVDCIYKNHQFCVLFAQK